MQRFCGTAAHALRWTTTTEYAKVLKMLGNCRVEAYCYDGVKRLCHIRGNMRKKVWVVAGDIVLVAPREFEDVSGLASHVSDTLP